MKYGSLITVVLLALTGSAIAVQVEPELDDCSPFIPFYEFLSTTPLDTRVMGHPIDTNCIPMYSNRSMVMSDELTTQEYTTFGKESASNVMSCGSAYYSDDDEEMKVFCENHSADYVLVNVEHFSEEALDGRFWYWKKPEDHHHLTQYKRITENMSSEQYFFFADTRNLQEVMNPFYTYRCT